MDLKESNKSCKRFQKYNNIKTFNNEFKLSRCKKTYRIRLSKNIKIIKHFNTKNTYKKYNKIRARFDPRKIVNNIKTNTSNPKIVIY